MSVVMEVANFAHHNLPYFTSAAGALIGAHSGRKVHKQVVEQRQALIDYVGEEDAAELIDHTIDVGPSLPSQRSLMDRIRSTSPIVGSIAASAAAAGFAIGMVFDKQYTTKTVKPQVQYVAPMPGAIGSAEDKDSPMRQILDLGQAIQSQDNVEARAVVARAGEVRSRDIEEMPQSGLGKAPMEGAIDLAASQIEESESERSAAIVVATTSGDIGSPQEVIRDANSMNVRSPVYIFDISSGSEGDGDQLRRIAEQTGGEYYRDIDEDDVAEIAESLNEAEVNNEGTGTDPDGVVLAIGLTGLTLFFRRRIAPKLPVQYHGGK